MYSMATKRILAHIVETSSRGKNSNATSLCNVEELNLSNPNHRTRLRGMIPVAPLGAYARCRG
jgi:hypothetical protein